MNLFGGEPIYLRNFYVLYKGTLEEFQNDKIRVGSTIADIYKCLKAEPCGKSVYLFNDSHYYIPEKEMKDLNSSILITGN